MNFSCNEVDKITNPGLKRLYTIRCNRFKPDNNEPTIGNISFKGEINYNLLYLLLLIIMFLTLAFLFKQDKKADIK
tara:strand:- start:1316 stop:1543 length:228 start_codon:yes stop_codon:yes gene_type:complete